jgi:alkanesulfonate monooxygenase SsuD/methylene tetrahydromethanopterin reductase-like flavin-dependent oxidoreductase (luciferase family)
MQLDLFMELASPPGSEHEGGQVFEHALTVARAADRLGFDAIWLAEHHLLGDYSNSAAPDMVLAAMARETRCIRLGFGIVPLPLHHPLRVAERLATLDALSSGRVLWGIGRGVSLTELDAFGATPGESRSLMLAHHEQITRMLRTGVYQRGEQHHPIRPTPRPDLAQCWLAAVSPESFDLAARLGLDVMSGPFKPWPLVHVDLQRYRRRAPGGRTSFAMAVYCEPDHAAARRRAEHGILWAYRRILSLARPMLERQLEGYEHYRHLGWLSPLLQRVLSLGLLERLGLAAVGDPAHVAARLSRLQRSGLDRLSLIVGGGDLSTAETVGCLELLAREVRPMLAARGAISAQPANA